MTWNVRLVVVLVAFGIACFGQTSRSTVPLSSQINETSDYCNGVDQMKPSYELIRLFSDGTQWKIWTAERQPASAAGVASAWFNNGIVVAAAISSQAAALKGVRATSYCFRENGSLARIAVLPALRYSDKAGLHSTVNVGRSVIYLPDGQTVVLPAPTDNPQVFKSERTTLRYLDPPAVYKSVSELPFVGLIK